MGNNIQKLSKFRSNGIQKKKSETPLINASNSRTPLLSICGVTIGAATHDEKLVFTILSNCTLPNLLDRLVQENTLTVPFSEPTNKQCLGMIGVEEFVEYVVHNWKETKRLSRIGRCDLCSREVLRNQELGVIFAMLRQPRSIHWTFGDHLEEVLTLFAAGVQRVIVHNKYSLKQPSGYKILSQLSLLRYISAHPSTIGAIASESATEYGTSWSRIPKVKADAPLIRAFLMMNAYPGFPIAVLGSNSENKEELLLPARKGIIIGPAEAKTLMRLRTSENTPQQRQRQQEEETIIGYLSESDFAQYFNIIENILRKEMNHFGLVTADEEQRGRKSAQSELDDREEPIECLTVYAYLHELRLAQQRDTNHIVSISENATVLDVARLMVKENVHHVCLRPHEKQLDVGEAERTTDIVVTSTSIYHKLYAENSKRKKEHHKPHHQRKDLNQQ